MLADRACLLIADDVWKRDHAAVFQVGGPRCRLLLTTRNATIANQLGATLQPVPEMTPDEAVYLLKQWAQGELEKTDNALLQAIVARLKYLPLAVKLAGSQLQRKEAQTWLDAFDVLKLSHRRPETAHDSLRLTFGLSLDELDKTDRQHYAALSIFKDDEATPLAGVQKLWQGLGGLDNDETVELLVYLADRALLEWHGPQQTILLHDLLREMMASELGEAGHMVAHRALLDTYRQTKTGTGWATAPDDGYLYNHLVYHLDELGDEQGTAELHSLFADDVWLNVRVPADDYRYDGFLADLLTTWQRVQTQAEKPITTNQPFTALAYCIHYALIYTSINSIAASYDPTLVVYAVQVGLWQPQRALSLAQRIPAPEAKSKMLIELLSIVSAQFTPAEIIIAQTEAVQAAMQIGDEVSLAYVLGQLAPQLNGGAKEAALAQALQAARQIRNEERRAYILGQLAPQLTGDLLEQALQAARQIGGEGRRAEALGQLAPQLTGDLLEQVLQAVRQIGDEGRRAEALGRLAPQLSGNLLDQKLQHLVIEDVWKLQNRKREVLLNFLAADGLLTAESLNLPPASLEAIARSVIEICHQWRWL